MKRRRLIFKLFLYYIIGFIPFIIITHVTYTILVAILIDSIIVPLQDIHNILKILLYFFPWYIIVYTIIYLLLLCAVRKYDRYTVNKLNEKLEKMKGGDKNA